MVKRFWNERVPVVELVHKKKVLPHCVPLHNQMGRLLLKLNVFRTVLERVYIVKGDVNTHRRRVAAP